MKFKKKHLASLLQAIKDIILSDGESILINDNFNKEDKTYVDENLTHIRFIWDLFWASKWSETHRDECSEYLDAHIQTALEYCYKELKK